jgi:proline dehydrogenase
MRSALLAGAESGWLRERALRWRFVRLATRRFMPGERLEDALEAARALNAEGQGAILTHLGENLSTPAEAQAVVRHYVDLQEQVRARGLDAEPSVKLTQLGLDLGLERARANLLVVAEHAARMGRMVWVDMESSAYTDRTLEVVREARRSQPGIGLCLQSYLRRTEGDLEALIPSGAAIRLVKGAYREPASIAYSRRRQVDESFLRLAARLLSPEARRAGAYAAFGTHDAELVRRIRDLAVAQSLPPRAFEFAMLYGIRRDLQKSLSGQGHRVRVLISYGESWFPWYMRRLAERPANVWFVARNLLRG